MPAMAYSDGLPCKGVSREGGKKNRCLRYILRGSELPIDGIFKHNFFAVAYHYGTFNHIFELAYIAGKLVTHNPF